MLYVLSILGLLVIMCVGCNNHKENLKGGYSYKGIIDDTSNGIFIVDSGFQKNITWAKDTIHRYDKDTRFPVVIYRQVSVLYTPKKRHKIIIPKCDTVYIHDTVVLKSTPDLISIDSLLKRLYPQYGFPQRRILNNWTIDTLYY